MSLRSAWNALTGRKTRKYNKLSDIDQSISKLDPDEISEHILNDPSLTPRRKDKLQVLLKFRDHGKKYGLTGKQVKEEAEKLAKRMMREKKEKNKIEEEGDLLGEQFLAEADINYNAGIRKTLPSVPRGPVIVTGRRSSSKSASKGGRRKTSKRRSHRRR